MRRIPVSLLLSLGLSLGCSHLRTSDRRIASHDEAPVYAEEFISSPGAYPANHGSTLVELPNGELLGCWYAGSREMGRDVQVYCKRSVLTRGEEPHLWSEPAVVVGRNEIQHGDILKSKSIGNPALFYDADDRNLYLFYSTMTIGGWAGVRPFYRISKDLGRSWQESQEIQAEVRLGLWSTLGRIGKNTRIKPIGVPGGEVFLPLYYELDEKRVIGCLLTLGESGVESERCYAHPDQHILQPSFVLRDGVVHAFMRCNQGWVRHATFHLQTHQWTVESPTDVPNPNSSVDTVLSDDGHFLLVGNPAPSDRYPLSLLVSEDGTHFRKIFDFDADPEGKEYSYPAFIRTSDGFYHLSYTYGYRSAIKHVRFNEAWLREKMRAQSGK